jgi:hypothetical protein
MVNKMKTIRNLIWILLFFFPSSCLFSQNEIVHFDYDLGGNRIKRWIANTKMIQQDSTDTIRIDSTVKKIISNFDKTNMTVTLYPNPTASLLNLQITGIKCETIIKYSLVSLSGQELLLKTSNLPITQIDVSKLPPGLYIVHVKLGEYSESWKIIKQ